MCEGFFLAKVSKTTESGSSRAVDPPPHLDSKYVEYSTKIQTCTFIVRAMLNIAYKTIKSRKTLSTNLYIYPSKFYRLKFRLLRLKEFSGQTNY
jgi:hypothetical protein